MATQEYAASIQGVSIRVTRLDAAGNLLNGPGDSYTTSAFMRVSFTPEYEEGDEITEKSANGTVCVTYKAPDTLKRITMELAICEPDAELSQLLSGGLLLRKTVDGVVKSVGWAAPGVGDDPAGNGVAIEAWSHAVKDGKRASVLPYFHWVFPYAKLRQSGDRVIENGMLATTFEGYGLGNKNFGSAVDGRWEFPVASERPYSYSRASWAPVGLQGFYTWTDQASYQKFFTIGGIQGATTIAITGISGYDNYRAVTLGSSTVTSGIANGDKVYVNNCGEPFNTSTVGESVTSLNYVAGTATANVTASNTTITVANTAGYVVGQDIFQLSGTGTLSNTTIATVVNATAFTVTAAPSASGTLTFGLVGMGATANVAVSNTTIQVVSTAGLVPGMTIAKLVGGASLANTTIATIVNATAFTVTTAPTVLGNLAFSINGGNAFYYSNYPTTANLSSALTATLDKYSRVNLVDSITEAGSYTPVTTTQIDTQYASGAGEDTYNVPGSLNYNADSNVDFIIKSNED